MLTIEEKDVSIDKILDIFKPWNLPIEIKEFAPAVPKWNLLAEVEFYIDVPLGFFETDIVDDLQTNDTWTRKLVVSLDWTRGIKGNMPANRIIMSVLIISDDEIKDEFSNKKEYERDFLDKINMLNSPQLNSGGTLIYNFPEIRSTKIINYTGGVLCQNIIAAAEDLLIGSKSLRQSFARRIQK